MRQATTTTTTSGSVSSEHSIHHHNTRLRSRRPRQGKSGELDRHGPRQRLQQEPERGAYPSRSAHAEVQAHVLFLLQDARPSKRAKIYQACEACQRRKSRCEGLSAQGCARCLSSGKTCSLAAPPNGSARNSPTAAPTGVNGESVTLLSSMLTETQNRVERLQQQLSRVDERVKHIEGAEHLLLSGAPHATSSDQIRPVLVREHPMPPTGPPVVGGQLSSPARPARTAVLLADYSTDKGILFDEQTTMLRKDVDFYHPVTRGILSREQADMLFQL